MNKIINPKPVSFFKLLIILASLTAMLTGCRALSDKLDPDKNGSSRDLPSVKRENPNLSSEPAPIKVDPDSEKLIEETRSAANPKGTPEANTKPENVAPGGNYVVTFDSFGKVKVGMTVAQAEQALMVKLVRGSGYENACYYVEPEGLPGVRFMVTNEKIARVDISSASYVTDKGAKVGDTEGMIVEDLYPRARVQPQKYDEKKHDIEIYSADEKYLIVFETDGNRVTGFRFGNVEEVSQVNGCS